SSSVGGRGRNGLRLSGAHHCLFADSVRCVFATRSEHLPAGRTRGFATYGFRTTPPPRHGTNPERPRPLPARLGNMVGTINGDTPDLSLFVFLQVAAGQSILRRDIHG